MSHRPAATSRLAPKAQVLDYERELTSHWSDEKSGNTDTMTVVVQVFRESNSADHRDVRFVKFSRAWSSRFFVVVQSDQDFISSQRAGRPWRVVAG
jgi:hypothetical protein